MSFEEYIENELEIKKIEKKDRDLSFLINTLDCGDNSCLFRDHSKPSGIRTNGGCRCFKDLPAKKRHFVHRMFYTLKKMR